MNRDHPAFKKGAAPFYDIIMEGLRGEVDGEHFWDAVAKDAVFEFLYNFYIKGFSALRPAFDSGPAVFQPIPILP